MMIKPKRRMLLSAMFLLGSGCVATQSSRQDEKVIKIVAKKFDFTPNMIHLEVGVPVVLELTTLDRIMGFNIPEFKVRTDIIPGKATQLHLTPDKVGGFEFYCDVFCGSGHEEMAGTILVREK